METQPYWVHASLEIYLHLVELISSASNTSRSPGILSLPTGTGKMFGSEVFSVIDERIHKCCVRRLLLVFT